jgi:hypothetical protein
MPRRCRRGKFEFSMDRNEAVLFSNGNGRQTILEIFNRTPSFTTYSTKAREELTRLFFERMWQLGHLRMLTTRR